MGGDFCLEYFSIENGKEPNWTAAREKIEQLSKIHISHWKKTCGDAPIQELFESHYNALVNFETGALQYEDEIQPDMNDRIRICEDLIECLNGIRRAWEDGSRESVVLILRERRYLFTGGLSYGDPPTDNYERIRKLYCIKAIQAAGFEDE